MIIYINILLYFILLLISSCIKDNNVQKRSINNIVFSIEMNEFLLKRSDTFKSDFSASKTIVDSFVNNKSKFIVWKYDIGKVENFHNFSIQNGLKYFESFLFALNKKVKINQRGLKYLNDKPFIYIVFDEKNMIVSGCISENNYITIEFKNFQKIDEINQILETIEFS